MSMFSNNEFFADYPSWVAEMHIAGAGIKDRKKAERFLLLLRAIENGNSHDVRKSIGEGFDPNMEIGTDETLFKFAVQHSRDADCLKVLVDAGARATPWILVRLAGKGQSAVIRDLVGRGADLNVYEDGQTVIGASVEAGDAQGLKELLTLGGNPNLTTTVFQSPWKKQIERKATPLMLAAYRGDDDVARILIDAGADIKAVDSKGKDVVTWAKACPDAERRLKVLALFEKAGVFSNLATDLPEPPDFKARAKNPKFLQSLDLAGITLGTKGVPVVLGSGKLPGAKAFPVQKDNALKLLRSLRADLQNGFAFISTDVMAKKGECIVVLPATDLFEAVTAFEIPVGQKLSSEELNEWLKAFLKDYPLDVTHLAPDRLEGELSGNVKDSVVIAKRIMEICGDVGEGDVSELAESIQSSRRLFLWWD